MKPERLERALVLGELSLDGGVRPVRGALPVALHCRRSGFAPFMAPAENAAEASVVDGVEVIPGPPSRSARNTKPVLYAVPRTMKLFATSPQASFSHA